MRKGETDSRLPEFVLSSRGQEACSVATDPRNSGIVAKPLKGILVKVGIIGLGYVGLPLCLAAVRVGHKVWGFDSSQDIVDDLNRGVSHIDDVSPEDLKSALDSGVEFVANADDFHIADVIIICVPTPLAHDGGPDTGAVEEAGRAIARILRPNQLVVLESTTYPGTTEGLLLPILESTGLTVGKDFYCAFSPERIDPGNSDYSIVNTPKVVGGVTPICTDRAVDFYQTFVSTVVRSRGTKEAEFAKLLENTYRHVNIALVNELAKFCHLLEIDLWDAITCASTKPFGFEPFFPGPGVGGHCIPIDPNYLSHHIKTTLGEPFRFVELAQEINDSMPGYVVSRVEQILTKHGKDMAGAKVLILGVTYKANIGDERESPAREVARVLMESGACVYYHDPFIEGWMVSGTPVPRVLDIASVLDDFDLAIVLQSHSQYRELSELSTSCLVLDTRGKLHGTNHYRL